MNLKHIALVVAFGAASPAHASVDHYIATSAVRNHVPSRLLYGIIMLESGGRCHAVNGRARGAGQVFPATARSVGVFGNLFVCSNGIEAAARYLRLALIRGGRGCAGLSLYNMGVAARPRCSSYGRRVLALASRR